jgi:UDP-N-acetylglucosamine 2-epimerase (non-hydrolysing)
MHANARKRLAVVLGIRPDVIRASLILRFLRQEPSVDLRFIWSGQHYSDNLKDVFFRELDVSPAEVELGVQGTTDAEISAGVIARLYPALEALRPEAAVFLGDTNTVIGCVAAAQLNIPVVHIEGCMRSYDWRMPEEKYRTISDHLSDRIYAYLEEYRAQGVAEGLNPDRITVVGNPIVDVLNEFYHGRAERYERIASAAFFADRRLAQGDYYLMTCHRRENVGDRDALSRVLALAGTVGRTVYFPASYRTQRMLKEFALSLPRNVSMVDPVGYDEFLTLLVHSRGTLTDSGTVVEEACILQVPSVQMRRATERPQVYDVGSSVKFDPSVEQLDDAIAATVEKLERLHGVTWTQPFGDGRSSRRIADDLIARLQDGALGTHDAEAYHVPIGRSYRGDGFRTSAIPAETPHSQ